MKSLIIVMVLSLVFAIIRAIRADDKKWLKIIRAKKVKRKKKR